MFTINFFRVNNLAVNVKNKVGFPYTSQLTTQMVKNGNSGNFQLHNSNTFDVNFSITALTNFDYCTITVGDFRQINIITGLTYVNDTCTTVNFKVDYFTTARAGNYITNTTGYLERTFLDYDRDNSFINQLSEPFSVNTIERVAEGTSTLFNEYINGFTGQSDFTLWNPFANCRIVVIISQFLAEFTNMSAWDEGSNAFTTGLKDVDELPMLDSQIIEHSGGFYNGIPITFANHVLAGEWITRALNNSNGFRVVYDENGLSGEKIKTYIMASKPEAGYFYHEQMGNICELDVEAVRLVTNQDIIDVQVIPTTFCVPAPLPIISGLTADTIPVPHDLTNIHSLGVEPNRNSKVLSYPFTQYSITTAFGDSIDLIPQVYNQRVNVWTNKLEWDVALKYIGGSTPRLMLWVNKGLSELNPFDRTNQGEWITIRCFPSIPVKADGTLNQNNMYEIENSRKIQTNKQHMLQNNLNQNPFRSGLRGNTNTNAGTSTLQHVGNVLGAGLNAVTFGTASNLMSEPEELATEQATQSAQAGNVAGSSFNVTSTGGNFQQMLVPHVRVTSKCATNSEQWAVCRFWDRHGQSASGVINPFNTTNTIFGGRGTVTQIDGREYYVMSNVIVDCALPQVYRDAIHDFFTVGGYLLV